MHLRSGAYYRTGVSIGYDTKSRASTQESTARTQSQGTTFVEVPQEDSLSESSMDTHSTPMTRVPGLEFDGTLRFHKENAQGAKIYRDFSHRYVVKFEDHPSDFDPAPRVTFQGVHYISDKGDMFFLVDDPETVDSLGMPIAQRTYEVEEGPPTVDLTQFQTSQFSIDS